jgi:hypothetical protein
MPIATAMAGVTLRLEPGAFREVSMRFFHQSKAHAVSIASLAQDIRMGIRDECECISFG